MSSESPVVGPGLVDLEKELICSICTELLYQPLTLLDCLHTFCGSCLKEWFAAQAGSRRRSSSLPRFTCPACRAPVRETRPNATVTTLLDMFLAANPDRMKPAAEKEEIAQRYKLGDSVFPTVSTRRHSSGESDEDDNRRLLDDVRRLSLRGATRSGAQGNRVGNSSRSERDDSTGRATRQSQQRSARQTGETSDRTRQIEHQSSLRSLLSLPDAEVMEEQILQQIMEEGLLDGVDLNNLGPSQEEELSERIAEAYRRRYQHRSRSQQRREMRERAHESRTRARAHSAQRLTTPSSTRDSPEGPPVSRPQLLDPLGSNSDPSGRRRRLSEQGSSRRRQSPVRVNQASTSDDTLRPAARSSSDMTSERSRASTTARDRPRPLATSRTRRATESEQNLSRPSTGEQNSLGRNGIEMESPTLATSPLVSTRQQSLTRTEPNPLGLANSASTLVPAPLNPNRSRPSSSRSNASQSSLAIYVEPSVSCDRCGRTGIQYDLYKNCTRCKRGKYNVCMRCYRLGRGCLRWPGFAPSAQAYFEKVLASSNNLPAAREIPHVMRSMKYRRIPESAHRTMNDGKQMTNDDPARRLEMGFFCDICQSPANDCFWKCSQCNQGDWGFCNRCVNQGRCCTHPLLPICRISSTDDSNLTPLPLNASSDASTTRSAPASNGNESFKILSFSTNCDICTYPIPASRTRFHCLECNQGDYDVCANCYLKLVATNKIAKENGHNGWRRCPKGHRMVVVGFEDHDEGQRRVIVRDLVGGRALKDEHLQPNSPSVPSPEVGSGDWSWKEGSERRKKASRIRIASLNNQSTNSPESSPTTPVQSSSPFPRFPPDGGVGLTVHALWSWYPEDDVKDELTFPRGADITEAENINDDWYWGCYAGRTGLFPGAHVTVMREVA